MSYEIRSCVNRFTLIFNEKRVLSTKDTPLEGVKSPAHAIKSNSHPLCRMKEGNMKQQDVWKKLEIENEYYEKEIQIAQINCHILIISMLMRLIFDMQLNFDIIAIHYSIEMISLHCNYSIFLQYLTQWIM